MGFRDGRLKLVDIGGTLWATSLGALRRALGAAEPSRRAEPVGIAV